MDVSPYSAPKRDSLNIRIRHEDRSLIDRAAQSLGKNRSNFILDAVRRAAEEALLDRSRFFVTSEVYAEFLARLDETPKPNERLQRTMQTQVPWE